MTRPLPSPFDGFRKLGRRWSGAAAPPPIAFTARFGVGADQVGGSGAFNTNLYTITPPANGTYGPFSVTAGVITPNGSQTAGFYDVGGYVVLVTAGWKAIAILSEWNAISGADAGKTLLVREGAGITSTTAWNDGTNFGWATLLGDGEDPRLDISSARDSRKHFVSFKTFNVKKITLDRLRVVTGSTAGTKVDGIVMESNGGGLYTEDLHILRCVVIASRPDPYGDFSGGTPTFPGREGIKVDQNNRRVSIRDNVVIGSAGNPGAISAQSAEGYCEIVGNWIDLYYADGIRLPATPTLFGGNLLTRPMCLSTDGDNPHSDGVQYLGAKTVLEASAFILGQTRGAGDSIFSTGNPTTMIIRNVLNVDNSYWPLVIQNPVGTSITNYACFPEVGSGFPLSNPQGGIEMNFPVGGTNDITNSVYRHTSSSIDASVVRTGNVDSQSWLEADWTAAFPYWSISGVPTLQSALQYHALPNPGGAAAGKGPSVGIASWGAERSSYVLSVPTPVVSNIALAPTFDGFSGTFRTDVGGNAQWWAVIPQAQGTPDWREIKERRVPNAVGYGDTWCSRAAAGTDLAISCTTCAPGTAYKLCVVAENGWSVRSAVTTYNFTTNAAAISRIAVGAGNANNGTGISLAIPTSGLINGDRLVAFVAHIYGAKPNIPPGWARIGTGDGWTNNEAELSILGRVRDGSEGSTLTLTNPTSCQHLGFVAVYRGASAAAGAEATGRAYNGSPMNSPALTASAESCILHAWAHANGPITETMPNPGDLIATVESGVWFLGAENQLSVSAGLTTSRAVTISAPVVYNAVQVELLKA